jgi:hypothetical protein
MFCTASYGNQAPKKQHQPWGEKNPKGPWFYFKQWVLSFLHKESNQIKFLWTRGASKERERERKKDGLLNPHV